MNKINLTFFYYKIRQTKQNPLPCLTVAILLIFACTIITTNASAAPPKLPVTSTTTQVKQIANWDLMTSIGEGHQAQEIHWLTFPAWQEKNNEKLRIAESRPERNKFDLNSYQPLECFSCHENFYTKTMEKKLVHLPFAKKDCPICHVSLELRKKYRVQAVYPYDFVIPQEIPVVEISKTSQPADNIPDQPATPQQPEQVHQQKETIIYLRAQTDKSYSIRQKISLPLLDDLPQIKQKESTPPLQISDLKVTQITKALFISATITFKTNRLARAEIHNATQGKDFQTDKTNNLGYSHTRTLTGLQTNTDYLYNIICTDLSGNKMELTQQVLSVKDLFSPQQEPPSIAPLKITNIFYRNGDNYLVKFISNRKIKISLKKTPDNMMLDDSWNTPADHPIITSRRKMNIDICHTCHEYPNGHAINITPPVGMTIPDEYPTLNDGRMTCMSCHIGHAANIPFRIRKKNARDLCLGCHTDKNQTTNGFSF
jgi:predicted CXXCH cytochrome family protein